jgi:uncharacterized protein YgiM (DUF1202 family)
MPKYIIGVYAMKIELDINDAQVITKTLSEVCIKWKQRTKEMQDDKNCSLENYNEHLDACKKLGTIIEKLKEQL